MKKVPLILFLFLCLTTLGAQARSYQYHVGTKNKYPIGNKDVPAKVYLLFLKKYAAGQKYSHWHYSKYYEGDFMDTTWTSSNVHCIQQTTFWSSEKNCYCYDYSLIPGHDREDHIIDALSSQEVQEEFNGWYEGWLKNPTQQELCNYINETIAARVDVSYVEKAKGLECSYPEATIAETSEQTLWQEVDQIVNRIYAVTVDNPTPEASCYAQLAQDRLAAWGLVLSSDADISLPSDIPIHVVLANASRGFIREAWGYCPFGEWSRTDANGNTYTGEQIIGGGTLISSVTSNSNASSTPADNNNP